MRLISTLFAPVLALLVSVGEQRIMDSNSSTSAGDGAVSPRRSSMLSSSDYVAGIKSGDRSVLARAITLIESNSSKHEAMAQDVLEQVLSLTGNAKRIGITGVPGVGKSTFIEAFGCKLTARGHKLAVLTIDPTSAITGGSILGDKTRMEKLSREPLAYIRPTASGGRSGGVARRTRETILLCEAAGFDTIIVESVGVGQAEITLRSMVDYFLVLLLPGAGDELQGMKKGILEMADAVLINKADGDNRLRAEQARAEQSVALHYSQSADRGWQTEVGLCSALTGEGLDEAWSSIERFYSISGPAGFVGERRKDQLLQWLGEEIKAGLEKRFFEDSRVKSRLPLLQEALRRGNMTVARAAKTLLNATENSPGINPTEDERNFKI